MKAIGVLTGFVLLGSLSETVVGKEMEPRMGYTPGNSIRPVDVSDSAYHATRGGCHDDC